MIQSSISRFPGRKSKFIQLLYYLPLIYTFGLCEQMKVLETEHTFTGWYLQKNLDQQPKNWDSPIDYHRGYTYVRYELMGYSKSFSDGKSFLAPHTCYFTGGMKDLIHACTNCPNWKITEPGIYYGRVQNDKLWASDKLSWSSGLGKFMIIDNCDCVGGKNCNQGGRLGAKLRITVYIVSSGDTFKAPSDWNGFPAEIEKSLATSSFGTSKTLFFVNPNTSSISEAFTGHKKSDKNDNSLELDVTAANHPPQMLYDLQGKAVGVFSPSVAEIIRLNAPGIYVIRSRNSSRTTVIPLLRAD